nr:hypothetical protein [Tautonia rosea]
MPHEALDDSGRDASRIGQGGTLAPQGVEVEHEARGVPVFDPGGFQVDPEHRSPFVW